MKNKIIPPPIGTVKRKTPIPTPKIKKIEQATLISIDEPETQRPEKLIEVILPGPQKEEFIPEAQNIQQAPPVTQIYDDSKFNQPKKQQKTQVNVMTFAPPKKNLPVVKAKPHGKPIPPSIKKVSLIQEIPKQQNVLQVDQQIQPSSEGKSQGNFIQQQITTNSVIVPQATNQKMEVQQVQEIKQAKEEKAGSNKNSQADNQSIDSVKPIINVPMKNNAKLPVPLKKAIPPKIVNRPIPPIKSIITSSQKQEIQQNMHESEKPPQQFLQIEITKIQTSEKVAPIIQKEKASVPPMKPSSPKNKHTQIIPKKTPESLNRPINNISTPLPLPSTSASAVKSKISQKLQEIRLANQQMLADQSFCQQEQGSQQGQIEQHIIDSEQQYNKTDFIKQEVTRQREQQKQDKLQNLISIQATSSQRIQQPIVNKAPPTLQNKLLNKQPPAPTIKKIVPPPSIIKSIKVQQNPIEQVQNVEKVEETLPPPPQFRVVRVQQPVKKIQIVEVKTQIERPQPIPENSIKANQAAERQKEVTVKVKLQDPKPNNEINRLLERYNGLKNSYLNNLRQLDDLIHFQKQQQQSQIQRINHLLSQLHTKNETIKQMCSVKPIEQSYQNQEISI